MSSFQGDFATQAAKSSSAIAPVLEITLNSATWNGGTALYLSGGVTSARGNAYDPRVVQAGWGGISRYFDIRSSNLARLETTVTVADTDRKVQDALESGWPSQRGSGAVIYWAIPGNATDYAIRFSGILSSWEYKAGQTILHLRTNDSPLRSYVPNHPLIKAEWPNMLDSHVGTITPLIYGTRNSSGITSTGFIPTFTVSSTAGGVAVPWRFLISLGELKEVKTLFKSGITQSTSDYDIQYGYLNAGRVYTLIEWTGATAPTVDDVFTVDVDGFEATGNTGGENSPPTGALITNPVEQMRHLLVNHAEDKWQSGAWTLTGDLIDAESWADAAAWAEKHQIEGSGYVGGKPERRMVQDVLNEWLDSYPCFRAYWTTEGKLALRVIDLALPAYRTSTDPPVLMVEHEIENSAAYVLGVEDITDSITGSYLYDDVNSDFTQSLTVIDPDVGEDVSTSFDMRWSIARAI